MKRLWEIFWACVAYPFALILIILAFVARGPEGAEDMIYKLFEA